MPNYSNEAHVLEAALSLANRWRLQDHWQDARTLLNGLQPVAAKINPEARAKVWLQLGRVIASYAIRHIGFAHLAAEALAAAHEALAESLALREAVGFTPGVAAALSALAHVDVLAGDKAKARQRLEPSRKIFVSLGAPARVALIDQQITSFLSVPTMIYLNYQ